MNTPTLSDLRPPSSNDLLALARDDFACYGLALYPNFQLPPHLKILVEHLEAMERGEFNNLIVCMPPRYGKSLVATTLFPAWYLGRHPDHQVISASYNAELAEDFGRVVRDRVADPRHRAIFPDCQMSDSSAAANRFLTSRDGAYYAVGAGGSITGRGADLFLIDDPLKGSEDANSPKFRRAQRDWFAQVVLTRRMPGGKIVLVATRWGEDDLPGWLLREHAREGWRVLSFSAIAEQDETFRKKGEALWPERYSVEYLESVRRVQGVAAFSALYQQRPIAAEGLVFHRAWFPDYQEQPPRGRVVQSWDCAFKKGSGNSYSVCTTWNEVNDAYYLLHLYRDRVEFPDLKRKVAELA